MSANTSYVNRFVGLGHEPFRVGEEHVQEMRMGPNTRGIDPNQKIPKMVYYKGRECKVIERKDKTLTLVLITNDPKDYIR